MTEPTRPRQMVYVVSRWGEPSQTFVRREARAVRDLGVGVHTASLKRPIDADDPWKPLWVGPLGVMAGLARALVSRPRVTLHVLWTVARRSSVRNRPSQLVAAAIGLAWVGSKRLPPGHLHTHFGWVAATAAWAAATADGRTFSVMLHAFEIHDLRYRDDFERVPLQAASNVFVISERDRLIVAERSGVEPIVGRVGVPSEWLNPVPHVARERDLIAAVGRLVDKKGFDVLVEALALDGRPWRLEIAGDGPSERDLRAQIARLGLQAQVTLRGPLPEHEVRSLLHRASVLCAPSVELASGNRDGTPVVILEAMACGAAVVATDVGAIAEQVGDAGVIVPQRDPRALRNALDDLWHQDERQERVDRATARVASDWTVEDLAARLVSNTFASR